MEMQTKSSIRKFIYTKRQSLDTDFIDDNSLKICQRVVALKEFHDADVIYTYVGFHQEVATRPLIEEAWRCGKTVAVPKVDGWNLTFCELSSFEQLSAGYCDIPEPNGCPIAESETALMIMPGVAFDKQCNRVGYGQSFYDRYLRKHTHHESIALAFDFQIIKEGVPCEDTDVRPRVVITENQIFRKGEPYA